MSRSILIVDGYSIIHAWPRLRALHRRRIALGRDELIKLLTAFQDKSGMRVAVVFDGAGAKASDATEPGGIQVFYSGSSKTADDIIERLVAAYASQARITVATADLLERQTVITFGAECVSAEGLEEMIRSAEEGFGRDSGRYFRNE